MTNQFKTNLRIFLEFTLGRNPKDFKKIPIIINNYNRVTTLKKLINDLEIRGYHNIHIIDNNSDYPPLLDFYDNSKYRVYRLKRNIGFKALWKSNLWYKFLSGFYCYTDSDLSLVKECPDDFLEKFYGLLKKDRNVHKVGFSLKIDDLPDYYDKKKDVIEWESKYYEKEKEPNIYIAPIDTTFALYRPFARRGKRDGTDEMLRVGFPYQCHHMPWYVDSKNLSEEEKYYINSVNKPTHWSKH
jgi:hypothetical protein